MFVFCAYAREILNFCKNVSLIMAIFSCQVKNLATQALSWLGEYSKWVTWAEAEFSSSLACGVKKKFFVVLCFALLLEFRLAPTRTASNDNNYIATRSMLYSKALINNLEIYMLWKLTKCNSRVSWWWPNLCHHATTLFVH